GARGKVLSRRHPPSRPPNSPLERRRSKQPSGTHFQPSTSWQRPAANAALCPSGTTSFADPLAGQSRSVRPIFRWSAPSFDPLAGHSRRGPELGAKFSAGGIRRPDLRTARSSADAENSLPKRISSPPLPSTDQPPPSRSARPHSPTHWRGKAAASGPFSDGQRRPSTHWRAIHGVARSSGQSSQPAASAVPTSEQPARAPTQKTAI